MNSTMLPAVFYTCLPAAAVLVALILGLSYKPKGLMINVIQAFSAGILLAGIAVDLLPQLNFARYGLSLSVALLLGLLLMLGLTRLNPACCASESKKAPLSPFITAFSLEFFINGIVIVLSALAGQFVSMVTAISLSICCFVCGLAITTRFITVHFTTLRIILFIGLMALLFPLGGLLAYLFLLKLPIIWVSEMIAFGVGVLLYITTTDLLIAGFKPKSYWPKLVFYVGFLLILWIKAKLAS